MLKYSRQRECIKACLADRCDHPTAETIYEEVRKQYPNISLGTVYRNLSLLAERGEILQISTLSGPDRFDGNTSDHYHFLCRKCSRMMDIMPSVNNPYFIAEDDIPGIAESYSVQITGLCRACASKI